MKIKFLTTCFTLLAICLLVYSYGFVDFNLTLSSNPLFLNVIGTLQNLVYYQRQLSGNLFLVWAIVTTAFYLLILRNSVKLKKFPWRFVMTVAVIFTVAYPLFSYDIFNYMFHSKIIWHYHENPHLYAPQYFVGDPWLRFMRWVHTPSAYGPGHTLIYSLVYPLGLGKFTLVLAFAKLIPLGFYLWTIHLIGKIGGLLHKSVNPVILQLGYALNPLILVELLGSGHNDGIMMAFYLYALLLFVRSKLSRSLLSLLVGVAVKFVTIIFLPAYILSRWFSNSQIIFASSWLLYLPLLVYLPRFQPWYVVWFMTAAVVSASPITIIFALMTSILTLFYYYPYISTGFWNNSPLFTASLVVTLPILYLIIANVKHLFVHK